MKMTSAQAAKLLRQLNDEMRTLRVREDNTKTYLASVGEDPRAVRPKYYYAAMQKQQREIERKIRVVKHALNVFNVTHIIPEFDMTIDEMLIYLPQLSKQCSKLSSMKDTLPKQREPSQYQNSQMIDYRYANYDPKRVEQDYITLSSKLARAQTALDLINNTEELEINL